MARPATDGWVEIASLAGPGVIRRIWATGLDGKEIAFFVDGEATPRIRAPYDDFFGKTQPFVPPLAGLVSNGRYSYVPIPFGRSIRVALSASTGAPPRAYYQINYELFDGAFKVESFPKVLSSEQRKKLESVSAGWRNLSKGLVPGSTRPYSATNEVSVAPGAKAVWLDRKGPGILEEFAISLPGFSSASASDRVKLRRGLVLRLFWDGQKDPSVLVPLGDFFANGVHGRDFTSLPLSVRDGVFSCRFPMPFKRGVRAELANETDVPVAGSVRYRLGKDMPEVASYFHATWRSSSQPGAPFKLWAAEGRGYLVGCYLISNGADGSWNMLEGDESIRIDGEPQPSFHGTGLEDCFNGAWYYDGLFDMPLHGLVEKAGPQTAQYRFWLPDRIPFSKSAQMEFEFGDGNRTPGYMSAVTYWYQSRPVSAGPALPPLASRLSPASRVEHAAIMAGLLHLEGHGNVREARELCDYYSGRMQGTAEGEMLGLRVLSYTADLAGYSAVSNAVRDFIAASPRAPALEQARLLEWYHSASTNMLLGVQVNGGYKLFLDGEQISSGDSPVSVNVLPLTVKPGSHTLAIEITPTRPMAGALVCLRTHQGDIRLSEGIWQANLKRPEPWPSQSASGSGWSSKLGYGHLPTQDSWSFPPNAFVGMQTGGYIDCIYEWIEWRNSKQPAFFLREFSIPEPAVADP
jgi:hypothetical protein